MQDARAGRENALRYCTETRRVSRRSCPLFERLGHATYPLRSGCAGRGIKGRSALESGNLNWVSAIRANNNVVAIGRIALA
jgi:hypothetical protein